MTGISDFNRPAFFAAERALKAMGWAVSNPARNRWCPSWAAYMRKDLVRLMACHRIYMLRGWRRSAGARFERDCARRVGIEVVYEV
jgi:hypothetical protein